MPTQNFTHFRALKAIFIFFSLLSIYGCNQLDIARTETNPNIEHGGENANDNAIEYRKKSLEEGSNLQSMIFGNNSPQSLEVDNLTFNVILDKLDFMPLSSVDSASGVVITDWYTIEEGELRIKVNVRILDDQLTEDSITVQMFKQNFDGTKWNDQGLDKEKADKIKESILIEARSLKTVIDLS